MKCNIPTSLHRGFLWPERFLPVGAGGSSSPAELQLLRVASDGGFSEDDQYLIDLVADLQDGGVAGDCYAILDAMWLAGFVQKDGADKVSKIYDLSNPKTGDIYYDLLQSVGADQQQWTGNVYDGHASISITSSGNGTYVTATNSELKDPGVYIEAACTSQNEGPAILINTTNLLVQFDGTGTGITLYTGSFYQPGINTMSIPYRLQLTLGTSAQVKQNGTVISSANSGGLSTGGSNAISVGGDAGNAQHLEGDFIYMLMARPEITSDQRAHIESVMASYFPGIVNP
jgi:hypothetical protein